MKINYHPAECDSRCDDETCPYTHSATWEYNGDHFDTRDAAVAAMLAVEPPEFDPCAECEIIR